MRRRLFLGAAIVTAAFAIVVTQTLLSGNGAPHTKELIIEPAGADIGQRAYNLTDAEIKSLPFDLAALFAKADTTGRAAIYVSDSEWLSFEATVHRDDFLREPMKLLRYQFRLYQYSAIVQ